jgi:hypothetical protein
MHQKEENLTENYTTPLVSESNANQKSILFIIAFFRRAKPKVETASLRNLKVMPRDLNEIEFLLIPFQVKILHYSVDPPISIF